jgi:hypothetical protein
VVTKVVQRLLQHGSPIPSSYPSARKSAVGLLLNQSGYGEIGLPDKQQAGYCSDQLYGFKPYTVHISAVIFNN